MAKNIEITLKTDNEIINIKKISNTQYNKQREILQTQVLRYKIKIN